MTHTRNDKWFVFDVESLGLYGEAYAVAWLAVEGDVTSGGYYSVDPQTLDGTPTAREWARLNVPELVITHLTQDSMLDDFWRTMQEYMARGFKVASEVPYPVETNLLQKCVDLDPIERNFMAPYPLYDIASIRFAAGFNPLETCPRMANELPPHHPLSDCRQSARLLQEALSKLQQS